MEKPTYPTFDICNIVADKLPNEFMNADRFKGYLSKNPQMHVIHKHSFFHLVFFTEGTGKHVIDFETFSIKPGIIYFMRPNQVHHWKFESKVDGYIINFSIDFLNQLFIDSRIIDQFSFFNDSLSKQVIELDLDTQSQVKFIFEKIITDRAKNEPHAHLLSISNLIQLFVAVDNQQLSTALPLKKKYNNVILKNFKQLIEIHFKDLKLPKHYASLLFITPNHLNSICKDLIGISAGEIIRNRIILEAKRLLVTLNLPVSEVAFNLNFSDPSYFVKFFKKHTGTTPEAFRNKYHRDTSG